MEVCDRCKQAEKLDSRILGLNKYESDRYSVGGHYVPDRDGVGKRVQLCGDCLSAVRDLSAQFVTAALGHANCVAYTIHPRPRFPWFATIAFIINTASFLYYFWLCLKH